MNLQRKWDEPKVAKLTVADFFMLDREGALDAHGRTELIDGTIYVVSPQHTLHLRVKTRLLRRLADACEELGSGLEALTEGTIAIPPVSAPMPDVFVTTAMPHDGPMPAENVALVVEVSTSTQEFDLGKKALIYAAGGIAEYWVVDPEAGLVRRFWSPGPDGYGDQGKTVLGERVASVTITGLAVETEGLI